MDRFKILKHNEWPTGKTQYVMARSADLQTDARKLWEIYEVGDFSTREERGQAFILATEKFPKRTTIDFVDGAYYENALGTNEAKPIGEDFVQLTNLIVEEIQPQVSLGNIMANQHFRNKREDANTRAMQDVAQGMRELARKTKLPDNFFEPIISNDPKKPAKNAGFDAWFDFYHLCKRERRKYTLPELAKDMGYSLGHVKTMHALYKSERGI
jgi:hypothetical protein